MPASTLSYLSVATVLSLAAVASGCVAEPLEETAETGSAIVGGIETSDYAGIGYLQAVGKNKDTTASTGAFCTGSLIAPDVVLTAAHCMANVGGPFQGSEYTFDHVAFGIGKSDGSKRTKVKSIKSHPGYRTTGGGKDMTHDMAYLVLESAVTGATPLKVRRTRHLGSCEYVATGYGVSLNEYERGTTPPPGSVGVRKALVVCADKGYVGGMIETYSDKGAQCSGDSGGPLRVRNTNAIVGVVSFGVDATCKANNREYYAAIAANLPFVDEAIAASRANR